MRSWLEWSQGPNAQRRGNRKSAAFEMVYERGGKARLLVSVWDCIAQKNSHRLLRRKERRRKVWIILCCLHCWDRKYSSWCLQCRNCGTVYRINGSIFRRILDQNLPVLQRKDLWKSKKKSCSVTDWDKTYQLLDSRKYSSFFSVSIRLKYDLICVFDKANERKWEEFWQS